MINRPWTQPIATPSTSISSTASGQGTFSTAMKSTNSTPTSAITEPTESSMPPVMMTKAWPIAKMPNRPTRLEVFEILIGSRKRGLMIATTTPTTMIRMKKAEIFLVHALTPFRAGCLPTASSNTFSSLNWSRSSMPQIRPSCMTAMRSETPISPPCRWRSSGPRRRHRRARASAGRSPPWRRHRCRASARRRSSPSASSPAIWRARPSADCRPTASRCGSRRCGALMPRLRRCASAVSASERVDTRKRAGVRARDWAARCFPRSASRAACPTPLRSSGTRKMPLATASAALG